MERKRTALVTGGAKGIGRAIALRLADEGFSLAIAYRSSEAEAFRLVAQLQSRGVNAVAFKADLADEAEAERLYRECRAYFGSVDTLVNNAGISLIRPLYECTAADFDRVVGSNLASVFNTCRLFSPDMASEGFGRIVNIASVWGEVGASAETVYSATKAGVIGFTKALSKELAPSGVLVNSVSPGFIDTDMNAHLTADERAAFLSSVAMGRAGTPDEVADVVELLTRARLYITGADIPVNGGTIV